MSEEDGMGNRDPAERLNGVNDEVAERGAETSEVGGGGGIRGEGLDPDMCPCVCPWWPWVWLE